MVFPEFNEENDDGLIIGLPDEDTIETESETEHSIDFSELYEVLEEDSILGYPIEDSMSLSELSEEYEEGLVLGHPVDDSVEIPEEIETENYIDYSEMYEVFEEELDEITASALPTLTISKR